MSVSCDFRHHWMCVSVFLMHCCLTLNSPPPTCCGWLWRQPILSPTHGCSLRALLPHTLLAWRCHSLQKWVVIQDVSCRKRLWFRILALWTHICHISYRITFNTPYSLTNRKVRHWYSLMGNQRQGARWRSNAVRKREQIRTCWSRGITFCPTHFSWMSPLTRKMASWLA